MASSLSDPATDPTLVKLSPLVPQSGAIAITGTAQSGGLAAPISGIYLPVTQGSVSISSLGRGIHHLGNGLVACPSHSGTFFLIDCSDPTNPTVANPGGTATISNPNICTSWGRYLAVAGTASSDTGRLSIYDVSNPHTPVALVSNLSVGAVGATMNYMRVFGPHLFIAVAAAHPNGAVMIYDISDPTTPTLLSSTVRDFATDVALLGAGRYLAVNAAATLTIYDIADRHNPSQVYSAAPSGLGNNTQGIAPFEHYLAITSQGSNKVHLLDVANITSPTVVGSVATGNGPLQIESMGRLLAVSNANDQTVAIISADSVTSPQLLATVNLGAPIGGIALVGRSLVIGASNGTVTCVSLGPSDLSAARIGALDAARIRADIRIETRALVASDRFAVGNGGGTIDGPLSCANDLRGGHLGSSGPALGAGAYAPQAAAGTGASSAGSTGDDHAGQLVLQTGSGGWASGAQLLLTFARAYAQAPTITLTPANPNAAAAMADRQAYVSATGSSLTLLFGIADVAATTYVWNYTVHGH